MNPGGLALRNLSGSSFRSLVIVACVLVVAGFSLCTSLIIRGAESSLQLAVQRLGADVIVVPRGTEGRVETALLTGKPVAVWMSDTNYEHITQLEGVSKASPQIYLASLSNVSCCAVSEMFMIVVDPRTDFTVSPWLRQKLGRELMLGEVIGGSYIFHPPGEDSILLYGYPLMLAANLEPTGTGVDQTMFMNLETADYMARTSLYKAEQPLVIPSRSVSAVTVKAAPGATPQQVALTIMRELPEVTAIEAPNMFQSARRQIGALSRSFMAVLAIVWILSLVLVALVFSITANERRREIGVLRALGSTRSFVFGSFLTEAGILALGGALLGIALGTAILYLFRGLLVSSLSVPFIFPTMRVYATYVGVGLALALATVALAALLPALRASRQEPALAMRE